MLTAGAQGLAHPRRPRPRHAPACSAAARPPRLAPPLRCADNELNSWDYRALALALDNGGGRVHAVQVRTEEECAEALQAAQSLSDRAVLVECVLDKDDCSVELLQLGKTMQNSNKQA